MNTSNTIGGICSDGLWGNYGIDESINRLTVRSLNGGPIMAGQMIQIEAQVYAYGNGSYDSIDFWITGNAETDAVIWQGKTSLQPLPVGGAVTIKYNYLLPDDGATHQAIRVNFRFGGSFSSCSGGVYDDTDDLVFAVAPASAGASAPQISETKFAAAMPLSTNQCGSLEIQRCDLSSVCHWQGQKCRAGAANGNGNRPGPGRYRRRDHEG